MPAIARLLAATLVVLLGACATPPTLRVGSDLAHPPFIDVDSTGRPIGRDVELMEELAARVGMRVDWVRMPFDELFDALEQGKVDALCATLGVTPGRERRFAFTEPYYVTRILALVRSGPTEPRTLADLDGRRVAAARGTTSEAALREVLSGSIAVLDAESDLDAAARLRAGELDAALMDGPDASKIAGESGGALAVMTDPVAAERYAIALPHDSTELKERLDVAIEEMFADGSMAELDDRYGTAEDGR